MNGGPRRKRARLWAWLYGAIFDTTDSEDAGGDDEQDLESTRSIDSPGGTDIERRGERSMDRTPEYLLVLYVAEQRLSPPIPPGYVADTLDRSPSTTTEMLQRLASRGFVTHEPYEGATLTEAGRDRAAELYERYRTLSRFFRDVLDIEEHEEEALQLVGNVSTTVTERLANTLLAEDDEPIEGGHSKLVPFRADSARRDG